VHQSGISDGTRSALTLLVCAMLLAPSAAAQTSASTAITVTAGVLSLAPLTAAGVADLDFGTVVAGTVGSPVDLASDAGRFDLTGEPGATITLSFTLPTGLSGPGGSIPVLFGASDGLLWSPYPTAFSTFDPTGAFASTIDVAGNLSIGISGTVAPPLGTLPGAYSATVTLTVAYL
jgi:spore coat protein U-like protein